MTPRQSIRTRLRKIILFTTSAVLFLAVGTFVIYEVVQFRRAYLESMTTLSKITADNVTASLMFRRPEDAQEVLSSLSAEPTVELAVVYDEEGGIFAQYPSTNSLPVPKSPGADRAGYERGKLIVVLPSTELGNRKGTLLMQGTLAPLYERFRVYSILVGLVLGSSFLLAYLLSAWLQKRVSTPIMDLADVAVKISEKKDFSVRAARRTDDEIGSLTDAFNEMLEQIALRDAALNQNAERLRLALEASQTGTWHWDIPANRVTWDSHLHRLMGIAEGQFGGSREAFLQCVHPEDRAQIDRALQRALEKKKDFSFDFRTLTPAGEIRHMSSRGRTLEDSSGKPIRMTGVTIDMTEQKKAELAVRESEERFRTMADAAPVLIWTTDMDGVRDYFNRSWLEFTGRSVDQEKSGGWLDAVHEADRDFCTRTFARAFETSREFDIHYRLRRQDGEYRWIRDHGVPRVDREKRLRGFIGSCLDITDIRQAQAELERRVQARTAELAETNRELEAFTYSVSHDLRAPLRHINAYAQILDEDYAADLDDSARSYISRIRSGAKNMGMLVDDLLNLARVGRQELTFHPVDLNHLLADVLAENAEETSVRKIDWRIDDLGTTLGDQGLIRQVLTNLVSNAIKYTRPRQTAVIEIGKNDAPDGPVYFIRDNGVGFNMKYATKLFGVFQRLHRAEDFEGTGVGLATVERIVRKHGGKIWAEAELDKGATFYFTLPGMINDAAEPVSTQPPAHAL